MFSFICVSHKLTVCIRGRDDWRFGCVCVSVFSQDVVSLCSVGLCVLVAYLLLANTNLFLSKPVQMTVDTLADTDLTSTTAGETLFYRDHFTSSAPSVKNIHKTTWTNERTREYGRIFFYVLFCTRPRTGSNKYEIKQNAVVIHKWNIFCVCVSLSRWCEI